MKWLIEQIMLNYGWKKLLRAAWQLVDDSIKKQVLSTNTKWDDDLFNAVDKLIMDLTKE